ncbi:hypothetical protein Q1695_015406 [Nippostrongylus brasiliensis]|nr:hypothetical protein Q1695_015406 [Nippostrongylus brasiliensis]
MVSSATAEDRDESPTPRKIPCKRWLKDARSLLILGDGNLTFSLAVAESNPTLSITATVLDSEAEFKSRYEGDGSVERLRSCPNVELLFSVDATALPSDWAGKFHYIVMNFPHPGGKTNLKRSRLLLSGIFRSVGSIMDENTEFHLTLAHGQSGVRGAGWSPSPPTHEKDSWQTLYLAADEGLLLEDVVSFFPEAFEGYSSSGYRSTAKGFHNGTGAQRLLFKKSPPPFCLREMTSEFNPRPGRYNELRPYFKHDVSFLFSDEDVEKGEPLVFELLRELTGPLVAEIEEVEGLRSMCPRPYLPNRIYRLTWQVLEVAVGKRACNELQEQLRSQIEKTILERKLPLILS